MKTSKTLAVGTAILMLVAYGMNAEDGVERKQGKGDKNGRFQKLGELRAYRAKLKKSRMEFKKEQMEENKELHETLKDKEPQDALTAIIGNRKSQYSETKTFMDGLYNDFVSYAKEVMAKKEVPQDKQTEMLNKISEHRDEAVEKHAEAHSNLISALEGLKNKEDLTKEDIKNTISELRPDRKGKGRGNRRKNKEE